MAFSHETVDLISEIWELIVRRQSPTGSRCSSRTSRGDAGASFGPLSRASPPHDAIVGRLSRERRSEGNRRQRLTLSLCRLLYDRRQTMPGTLAPEDRPTIGSSFSCDSPKSLSDCNSTFEVKGRDRVLTRMSRPTAKGASTRSGSVFSQLGHLFPVSATAKINCL